MLLHVDDDEANRAKPCLSVTLVSSEPFPSLLRYHFILLCISLTLLMLYICYCHLITVQELPKLLHSRPNYSDECFLASYEDTFCVLGACSVWNESEAAHTALGHNIMPTSLPAGSGGSGSFYFT